LMWSFGCPVDLTSSQLTISVVISMVAGKYIGLTIK
jgi:hypothetical protein